MVSNSILLLSGPGLKPLYWLRFIRRAKALRSLRKTTTTTRTTARAGPQPSAKDDGNKTGNSKKNSNDNSNGNDNSRSFDCVVRKMRERLCSGWQRFEVGG
jgi:hypothetical protein